MISCLPEISSRPPNFFRRTRTTPSTRQFRRFAVGSASFRAPALLHGAHDRSDIDTIKHTEEEEESNKGKTGEKKRERETRGMREKKGRRRRREDMKDGE
jgi:hypothetical protein